MNEFVESSVNAMVQENENGTLFSSKSLPWDRYLCRYRTNNGHYDVQEIKNIAAVDKAAQYLREIWS